MSNYVSCPINFPFAKLENILYVTHNRPWYVSGINDLISQHGNEFDHLLQTIIYGFKLNVLTNHS